MWEGFRKDWVWESGVEYHTQPIRVSGVYVADTFRALGSGDFVDYPNGRVVLASGIPQASGVQCEFSYRLFQTHTADHPAWQTVQTRSFRNDSEDFLLVGSGAWDVMAQNRVQLPAVFVEAVPNTSRRGLMLGGGVIVRQSVLFHVLAEERFHYKWLHDALTGLWQKTIYGFDKNRMLTDDAFPLDENGSPVPSGLMYPDLVKASGDGGYFWEKIVFADTTSVAQPRFGSLWYCTVKASVEVNTD